MSILAASFGETRVLTMAEDAPEAHYILTSTRWRTTPAMQISFPQDKPFARRGRRNIVLRFAAC